MELEHLAPAARLAVGQASQAGVKETNDDCIGIRVPEQESLRLTKGVALAIADGVSAASAGKQAAQICVQGLLADYFSTPESWSVKHSMQRVFSALNRWLYAKNQSLFADDSGYLTTLSCLIIKSNTAHIFNVGDTRIYRLRGRQLELLTQDHVVKLNAHDSQLTRAMGLDAVIEIEYRTVEIEPQDIFLCCTDGLYRFLNAAQLSDLSALAVTDPERAVKELIDLALKNGSDDNLSCQLAYVSALAKDNVDDVYARLNQLPLLPPLNPGMKVDGLLVEEVVHENARSSVYRVTEADSGACYVMKAPNAQAGDDPSFLERFVLEEWMGKLIHSEHVVAVIQRSRPKQFLYYLTQFIPGQTLAQWSAQTESRDVSRIIEWVDQMVKGVRAFHRREALHQDIKPDNLMIDQSGMLKIVDFGSIRVGGVHEIATAFERDRILGTEDYSAPEQVVDGVADARSDLFSIAVVAYEMLSGKLPYGEAYGKCRHWQEFSKLSYQPVWRHNAMVPEWMDSALKKALSIHPDARYASLSEFIYDLKHPNTELMSRKGLSLHQRNPLLFWQVLAVLSLLANLFSWLWWARHP